MDLYNPISPLVPSLLKVMQYEMNTYGYYRTAHNWAANAGYDIAAKYFSKEASDEVLHTEKIQSFLNDWGCVYAIPTMEVSEEFVSLPDIVVKTYELMVVIYQAYSRLADEAYSVDKSAYNLAMEFVQIQYDAAAYWRTKVDQLKLINQGNKLDVLIYEQKAFENE